MSVESSRFDLIQKRIGAALLIVCMAGLVSLGGRLFYIQLHMRGPLLAKATQQKESHSVVPARRGMILDSRGRVVAASEHRPDVFVDVGRVRDLAAFAAELSPRLNLPQAEILRHLMARAGSRYAVILRDADEITADAIRAMKNPAVGLADHPARTYPLGTSLAHVLGWVGRDGRGLEGIELSFDRFLRGKDGARETIRDARRRAIKPGDDEPISPIDGGHVVLTIDAEIQRIAEASLAKYVTQVEAENGVSIIISPHDGKILAMACYPTFDPNDVNSFPATVRRNRVVTDTVEPGSTFKPIIACGALEGRHINTTEQFNCHMGSHEFHGRVVTDVHPYGMMDLKGVVTKSSNVGMGEIAERMGNRALHETVRNFGLGDKTGIELPGENAGMVRGLKKWGKQSTQSVAMGYEVGVTPLQLITAFAAIFNDGVLLKPTIVDKLLGPDGEEQRSFEQPTVVRQSAPIEIARYLSREVMVSVVENGTGKPAKLDRWRVAGKTGTTKLTTPGHKGYVSGAYMGTFVGAAPADDPVVVAMVMIRKPNAKLAYYGGSVAAPAVGEILDQTLSYLGVTPDGTIPTDEFLEDGDIHASASPREEDDE
ncbi:MAG: penicillin-binding protein 2 [Planctomycetes bacterium]|nr:penicillin-binding protein 2 [Planctomycetota bacterium]MBI3833857.1 penicillin-binding protein 2 [Planctomycetota bacterium]